MDLNADIPYPLKLKDSDICWRMGKCVRMRICIGGRVLLEAAAATAAAAEDHQRKFEKHPLVAPLIDHWVYDAENEL